MKSTERTYFKFQSDSINTGVAQAKRRQGRALNSNLILLILRCPIPQPVTL